MLEKIKSLFTRGMTADEFIETLAWKEARLDRPFFLPGECPFSNYVKAHGVEVRKQRDARHDN
jgi:hypothetical protein